MRLLESDEQDQSQDVDEVARLSQLEMVQGKEETRQAVKDNHYRVELGYEF